MECWQFPIDINEMSREEERMNADKIYSDFSTTDYFTLKPLPGGLVRPAPGSLHTLCTLRDYAYTRQRNLNKRSVFHSTYSYCKHAVSHSLLLTPLCWSAFSYTVSRSGVKIQHTHCWVLQMGKTEHPSRL